jgi:hypothetical protein
MTVIQHLNHLPVDIRSIVVKRARSYEYYEENKKLEVDSIKSALLLSFNFIDYPDWKEFYLLLDKLLLAGIPAYLEHPKELNSLNLTENIK